MTTDPTTDHALDMLVASGVADARAMARLALALLDQAGLTLAEQRAVSAIVTPAVDRAVRTAGGAR